MSRIDWNSGRWWGVGGLIPWFHYERTVCYGDRSVSHELTVTWVRRTFTVGHVGPQWGRGS